MRFRQKNATETDRTWIGTVMKFVTWNCAMALQKKYQGFLTLGADLMVIQECSQAFIEQINRSEGWSSGDVKLLV